MKQQTICDIPDVRYSKTTMTAERNKRLWEVSCGWPGPRVGEPLQVDSMTAVDVNGKRGYWYCTRCIAVQELPGGCWLVRVEYKPDAPLHCRMRNGTLLVLGPEEIWPSIDDLGDERNE